MYRLRTFGVVDLRNDEGEELRAVLAQPKRVALLAYLALTSRGDWQRRDGLMALFWPEQDTERARNALNQATFFLRRHLGADAIVSHNGEELRLDPTLVWCDALAFDDAIAAGCYGEAVELYRGELLASFHVPGGSAELERWLDDERHRRGRSYRQALECMACEREDARDFGGAAVWWRRLAAQDPYSGAVALRLMRAAAESGDRAGALDYGRVYQTLVREELGISPDPGVAELARALQAQKPNGSLAVAPVRASIAYAPPASAEPVSDAPAPPASSDAALAQVPTPSPVPNGRPHATRRAGWHRAALYSLVAVVAVATTAVGLRLWRGRATVPHIGALAVFPFANLTGDPAKEYLADVMTDELITELGRHPELRVTSRTSVLQYKGTARQSLPEIARELHVDAVVEGSLTAAGPEIGVNAKLVYAPRDQSVWAEHYRRDSTSIMEVEDDIADAIARKVRVAIGDTMPRRRPRLPANPVVQALYLRGQSAMLSRTPQAMREASAFFAQAIALDPSFAAPYAGLAEVANISGDDAYLPRRAATDSVRLLASRAIALDSSSAEGHTALAAALADDAHWADAEREYRRAIALAPSYALARHWFAQMLAILGRYDEALTQARAGVELDPSSASLRHTLAPIETRLGLSHRTSARTRQALETDPMHAWSRASHANALSIEGKCADARENIDRAAAEIPDNLRMLQSVVAVEWRCGDRGKARRLLEQMKRRPDARAHGFYIATIYNGLGERDSTFAWLEGVDWSSDMRFNLLMSAPMRALQSDPRYARVLRAMGLPGRRSEE